MSEKMLSRLRVLEGDYPSQPRITQQEDLREINRLRTQLGMPLVDANLKEMGAVAPPIETTTVPEPEGGPDHQEIRELYRAYLKKVEELEVHRAYADEVVRATSGPGQTPVRPLATMGPNGGPLLCDQCRKPIVLEGGPYHGVNADEAWQRNPVDGWVSWILGGMVVEVLTNGTLRIYHGYPGQGQNHCCNIASREARKAREKFDSSQRAVLFPRILAFIEHDFSDMPREEQFNLLNRMLDTMCSYDPGIGVNRPATPG